MAIKFNISGVSENATQLYTINTFNGCDYTTTPTLVNDSRAIEISNYLPINNSLVKRNGWEVINNMNWLAVNWKVHNIWRLINHSETNDNVYYILYVSSGNNYKLLHSKTLEKTEDINRGFNILYEFKRPKKDTYSYGITFDGRLFVWAQLEYLMIYFQQTSASKYELKCIETRMVAYTPTTFIGVGHKEGIEKPTRLEEYNLLNAECIVELVQYDPSNINTEVSYTNGSGNVVKAKGVEYDIGSLFGDNMDMNIATINDTPCSADTLINVEGVGQAYYDYDNGVLKIINMTEIPENEKDNIKYIKVRIFNQNFEPIVERMRFGIPYGSHGYKDRLFLGGNPNHPNMDIHSCETNNEDKNWLDYTYFGDLSYQMFGSDNQKIIGYGLMSTGYMAVIKETAPNEPNLYLRNSTITPQTVSDGVGGNQTIYVEQFPITASGIKINASSEAQIINFGNDLLINISSGIYRVNATTSTAVQGYEVNEVSYFIRNDLGKDMSGSCSIVHNDKLYVCRKNKDGIKRVYVADLNKYSFKDNVQIYEWFVLDGINAEKMFVFDDVMYFSDYNRGICKMGEEYFDRYSIESEISKVNGIDYSKDVFLNEEDSTIFVASESKIFQEIYNTTDLEKSYNNFKTKTKITFNDDAYIKLNNKDVMYDNYGNIKTLAFEEKDYDLLQYAFVNNCKLLYKAGENDEGFINYIFEINDFYRSIVDGETFVYVEAFNVEENTREYDGDCNCFVLIPATHEYSILEMYDENMEFNLTDSYIEDNTWYYRQKDELGNYSILAIGDVDSIHFNRLRIGINNSVTEFSFENAWFSKIEFHYKKPVESYWYSKYNDLGRLDYLKTASNITFVPDLNFGGYTSVGYKTSKNETSYYALAEHPHIDFANIDFENFFFGADKMAKTYSSKKKIKNFSFIQLRISSNDIDCSSIVSLSFRYKYTRNNKGVK